MITFAVDHFGEFDTLGRTVLHTYSAAFAFLCIDFDCSFDAITVLFLVCYCDNLSKIK